MDAGARHFMRRLVDGDLASNQHGWQWTAGTGTDAAPYFRVFNPRARAASSTRTAITSAATFPNCAASTAEAIHEPWTLRRPPPGYPAPIVDHAVEREEALARYAPSATLSSGCDPHAPVQDAPGSRTSEPAPELNASGAQVIGSMAMPGLPVRQRVDREDLHVAKRLVEPDPRASVAEPQVDDGRPCAWTGR